ncbi:putative Bracovirus protein MdBV-1-23 [Microplitis demolitor]
MDYVVDFTGYYVPNKRFIVKEFCLISIVRNSIKKTVAAVLNPPYAWEKLPITYQNEYLNRFYKKYGIGYSQGNCTVRDAFHTITTELKKARTIYLKNSSRKRFLLEFTQLPFENIECLDSHGYKSSPKMSPELCSNHASRKNFCVVQNANTMARWVISQLFVNENNGNNNTSIAKKMISKLNPKGLMSKLRLHRPNNSYLKLSDGDDLTSMDDSDDEWLDSLDDEIQYQNDNDVYQRPGPSGLNRRFKRHLNQVSRDLNDRTSDSNDDDVMEIDFENDKNFDDGMIELDYYRRRIERFDDNVRDVDLGNRRKYKTSKLVSVTSGNKQRNYVGELECDNRTCKKRITDSGWREI